jgi:hypothetical protein
VGFKEVDEKRKSWRKLGAKARLEAMDEELSSRCFQHPGHTTTRRSRWCTKRQNACKQDW